MAALLASEAFGDFFVFEDSPSPPAPAAPSRARAKQAMSTFVLPMRKVKHGDSTTASKDASTSDCASADATVSVALSSSNSPGNDQCCKPDRCLDGDMPAATDPRGSEASSSGRLIERSISLDTAHPHHKRDQSPAPHQHDATKQPSDSRCLQQSNSLRSHNSLSGRGCSAGSACGTSSHQHGGWHNSTEWWRSFSSSRLNELGVEEPDWRSPAMRKVPYVGGAEPMCAMVHGSAAAGDSS